MDSVRHPCRSLTDGYADRCGAGDNWLAYNLIGLRVNPRHAITAEVGYPDCARTDRQVLRPTRDGDRCHNLTDLWVNASHRIISGSSAIRRTARQAPRHGRSRLAEVCHHVYLGSAEAYRQALRALGLSGRIQTAFVERLNLTIRRSIAGLARRSWSVAHSLSEQTLLFNWWRAYYHFARPHASLRQPLPDNTSAPSRPLYRPRTPAQAAGLTHHRWTVRELLTYPAPSLRVG
jgi:transposase InsO family protein